MYNFYEYMYYRFYKWQKRLYDDSSMPQETAMLGVSTIQFFTIFIVAMILEIILKVEIIGYYGTHTKYIVLLAAIVIMIINIKLLKGNEKLKKIMQKYKPNAKNKTTKLAILMWLNIGLVISFPLLLLIDAIFFDFHFKNMFYNF